MPDTGVNPDPVLCLAADPRRRQGIESLAPDWPNGRHAGAGLAATLAATGVQKGACCCHSVPLRAIQTGALDGAATVLGAGGRGFKSRLPATNFIRSRRGGAPCGCNLSFYRTVLGHAAPV
jgi:hypothetical protein